MKLLTIALSLFALSAFSAEVNITNIPTTTRISGTDYVLGQTNGANGTTRRVQWNTPFASGLSPTFNIVTVTNVQRITDSGGNVVTTLGNDGSGTFLGPVSAYRLLATTNGSIVNLTNGTLQISNNLGSTAGLIAGSNVLQVDTIQLKKAFMVESNGQGFFGGKLSVADTITNGALNASQFVVTDANKALASSVNGATLTNLTATNITYPLFDFVSSSNTLTLMNGIQQFNATANVGVTNVAGQVSGQYRWATLIVSNSTAAVITQFVTAPSVRAIGTGATNQLVIGSGKIGITTFSSRGSFDTNYANAMQQ